MLARSLFLSFVCVKFVGHVEACPAIIPYVLPTTPELNCGSLVKFHIAQYKDEEAENVWNQKLH
ncbi:hypothetical protein D3C78_1843180 [compost metagenome]